MSIKNWLLTIEGFNMKKIFILLSLLLVPLTVNADVTVRDYENSSPKDKQLYKFYIQGLGISSAIMMIFETYEGNNKNYKKLYCVPEKLGLSADLYEDILKRGIDNIRNIKGYEERKIEMVLISGLIETFPCK